jgi:copper chaperone CopZ
MKTRLAIEGMSCSHCVTRIQAALSGIPGVTAVQVDLVAKSALVEGDAVDDARLQDAVEAVGYEVVAISH